MSNLLEKASIITTPTAYSDGKLHSVKPVQTLSDELVVNGDFATDSDWFKSGQVTIGNGVAYFDSDGTFTQVAQNLSNISGKNAKVVIEITEYTQGTLKVLFSGGAQQNLPTSVGTHTLYFSNVSSNTINIARVGGVTNIKIDNVSVKEVIDADFDFQRGSAATRVNSQGLIENVQTLSGNLVQNGDFSEIGSELVTNGGFDNGGENWANINNAVFKNSTVIFENNAKIYQNVVSDLSKFYKISIDLNSVANDGLQILAGSGNSFVSYSVNDIINNGNKIVFYSKFINNGILFVYSKTANTSAVIDNVSVKEVGQNWQFNTGWSMGDGKAVANLTTNAQLLQNFVFTIGKRYKVSFEILDYTSGSINLSLHTAWSQAYSANGVYTEYFTATQTLLKFESNLHNFIGSIDNISVLEITDDTDLPRIDYTDGCGSLLLEPQSTNLVPYSEPTNGAIGGINNVVSFSDINSFSSIGLYGGAILQGGQTQYIYNGQLISGSTIYAFSFYIKTSDSVAPVLASSNVDALGDFVFVIGGQTKFSNSFSDYSITQFSGNIYKVEAVMTSNANVSNPSNNGLIKFNTNRNADLEITGLQWEQLSYPTSYIPTNGSTATRLADVCNNAGSSDLINSTEGVLYAEGYFEQTGLTNGLFAISDGTFNNLLMVRYSPINKLQIESTGGVNIIEANERPNGNYKIAVKYNSSGVELWVNGSKTEETSTVSTMSCINQLMVGKSPYGNIVGYKNKAVAVFKEALTNDELEGLTGEGYDTFNALALANNYTII